MLSKQPIIIGLAGTLNAGKDSLADGLARDEEFLHVSTSDMIRLMKKREFDENSPQALLLRNDPFINDLREERGPGFLIDEINEDWKKEREKYRGGFIASGVRAIGEVETVHKLGGILVFVDANPMIRYQRSQARQRDENEKGKSFEEFIANENTEIDVDQDDKNISNLKAMREMADIIIENDHESIEEFQKDAVNKLKEYLDAQ